MMTLMSKAPGALCHLCPLENRPCIHPTPKSRLLALVGERPDKYELEKGTYFAGPSGEILYERILPQAGIKAAEIDLHNAVCCTIPEKLSPALWKRAIACCAPRLQRDLALTRPKLVIVAGKRALQALTGRAQITSWTGAPLQGWAFREHTKETKRGSQTSLIEVPGKSPEALADFTRYQLLPVMHPAWHFRGNNVDYLPMSRIHFARAKALATGRLPSWKWPTLEIHANERALRLLERLRAEGRRGAAISYDVESIGDNPFRDKLSCIGVGHRDLGAVSLIWESYDAGKYGFQTGVIDAKDGSIEAACRGVLLSILADERITKVAQNGQYDLMCLRHRGIPVRGKLFDTMVAHAVYAPALLHNLALICSIEFHAPRWKDEFQAGAGEVKGKAKFQKSDPIKLRTYNCKDNVMQSHLEGRCRVRLEETYRGQELFERRNDVLYPIANEMTWRGVRVSRSRRRFHHKALRTRMGLAAAEIKEIARRMHLRNFNPDSGRDLRKLFFGKFHVKPIKFSETTGAPSLDEKVLTPLITHPNELVQIAARATLKYRRWGTLDRNHVRGLRLDDRNTLHPFWKPIGTIGERWSGSRPNPLNIPKPIIERVKGKRVVIHGGLRDMFIPHAVNGYVVESDFKQVEARLAAFLANDTPALQTFAAYDAGEGPDPHTVNAIDLFGIKGRAPDKRERTLAKNFLYGGILYGGTIETIHAVLSIDAPIEITLVERLVEKYMAKHPRLVSWHQKLVKEARAHGYVEEPISGRRRHFWGHIKPTEVYNFPVQTLAGFIINEAIVEVSKELNWTTEGIMFQVHDSLVLDGPDPLKLAEILEGKMNRVVKFEGREIRCPVDIAVSTTSNQAGYRGRAWAPNREMTMDEIMKLPKGKEKLRD